MTYRFRLSFPSRADGALLPASLVLVLLAALAAQLAWMRSEQDVPPAQATRPIGTYFATPIARPVSVSPVVFDRPLFAPRKTAGAAMNGAPPPMLGGATVAGTVSVRGRTVAVIKRPNGETSNIAIGRSLDGWRLASLSQQSAVFVKGNERREVPYGTQPMQNGDEPASE